MPSASATSSEKGSPAPRLRADAQRNLEGLLQAAKAVFDASGLDAPTREIAGRAGVGVGTLYRHFPRRADLVAAVFQREIDACADAGAVLACEHPPFEALAKWIERFTALAVTKRGLAAALLLADPARRSAPCAARRWPRGPCAPMWTRTSSWTRCQASASALTTPGPSTPIAWWRCSWTHCEWRRDGSELLLLA